MSNDSQTVTKLKADIDALTHEVARLQLVAQESQDWNWISAKEEAAEKGLDHLPIDEMQSLWEAAHHYGADVPALISAPEACAIKTFAEAVQNELDAAGVSTSVSPALLARKWVQAHHLQQ